MTKDEALKLALEALEKLFGIPDKWTGEGGGDVAVWRLGGSYRAQQAITAIKAALEAKDEPVGFMHAGQVLEMQQGRLPYGYVYPKLGSGASVAIYATPPQRTWVELTDEEIDLVMPYCHNEFDLSDYRDFARDIEAKLKEKNT